MDDELRAYLDGMRTDIGTRVDAMRAEFNNAQEHLLNHLTSLEREFLNTKGFLIEDSIVMSRRWFDMEQRLSRLERDRGEKGA